MRIYAVTNIKGGVGKTTTAVNLAYLCAAGGQSTLLWDLDPQGGATYALRGEAQPGGSARKLLSGARELPELVLSSGYAHLDLLPADFSYRNFAIHLAARRHPTERLLRMSRTLRELYGALFLDCPGGMSLLTENVLRASDVVIVPLLPAPLSLRMLEELRGFLEHEGWTDLTLLPFFSMVDRRRRLHRELLASARTQFPELLATEIPDWSEIERMSVRRAPLPALAPRSEAARLYRQLWDEIGSRTRGAQSLCDAPEPAQRHSA
ncbi:MAG: ParA family protein [Gammaproteobacteria bacterium]|nr:ParA family protein [Gammaproteobacteria bacterium]